MSTIYSKPAIKRFPGKWFVEYYYEVPAELLGRYRSRKKRVKVYEGINRQSPEDQDAYAEELREAVEVALVAGYNPFAAELEAYYEAIEVQAKAQEAEKIENSKGEAIEVLLDRYLKAKRKEGLAERSLEGYKTFITHFENWLIDAKLDGIKVKDVTEEIIIRFLDEKAKQKSWKNKTYNSQREACLMWFNWFVLEGYLDKTPLTRRVMPKHNADITKNEAYTGRVREAVKKALENDQACRHICAATYYTCCRNYEELCHLQIKHIDRENQVIFIPEAIGKTGARYVPISRELDQLLFEIMKVDKYPLDYYIFTLDGLPGPDTVSKNYYSRRYKLIKDKLGLGNEYTIYGWKHTRVVDLLKEGFTDAEVMDLTGHTDTGSYDHYKRNLGASLNNRIKGITLEF